MELVHDVDSIALERFVAFLKARILMSGNLSFNRQRFCRRLILKLEMLSNGDELRSLRVALEIINL